MTVLAGENGARGGLSRGAIHADETTSHLDGGRPDRRGSSRGHARAGGVERRGLAKLEQNPVGNLISVPFQNNTNFNFGPEKGTQNVLNIQPVIPISIDNEWNIITPTILPVISMPALGPGIDSINGFGDMVVRRSRRLRSPKA